MASIRNLKFSANRTENFMVEIPNLNIQRDKVWVFKAQIWNFKFRAKREESLVEISNSNVQRDKRTIFEARSYNLTLRAKCEQQICVGTA